MRKNCKLIFIDTIYLLNSKEQAFKKGKELL